MRTFVEPVAKTFYGRVEIFHGVAGLKKDLSKHILRSQCYIYVASYPQHASFQLKGLINHLA